MGLKDKEPMPLPRPTLEVHIDRLVLHSYSPVDTHRLGEAVQTELFKLVEKLGFDYSAVNAFSIERLDGGLLKITSQPKIEALGAQLANCVHQVLISSAVKGSSQVREKSDGAKR